MPPSPMLLTTLLPKRHQNKYNLTLRLSRNFILDGRFFAVELYIPFNTFVLNRVFFLWFDF